MALSAHLNALRLPLTSVEAGRRYDAVWLSGKGWIAGILVAILTAQVFVYLAAVENSMVFGVSLAAQAPYMLIYIVFDFLSLAILLGVDMSPKGIARAGESRTHSGHHRQRLGRDYIAVVTGGSYQSFLLNYGVAFFAVLALMTLLSMKAGGGTLLSDPDALVQIIFNGLFVGPTETLFFVIALPALLTWTVSATVVFAFFHLPVDVLTYGVGDPTLLLNAFLIRAFLGFLLYLVYVYFGPGATMSAHTTYNLYVVGAIAAFPLGLSHLGMVPL